MRVVLLPSHRLWLLVAAVATAVVFLLGGAGLAAGSAHPRWVIRDLGTWMGGRNSEAVAVNDRGQVAVMSETAQRVMVNDKMLPVSRALLWQEGELRDLGATFGGPGSWPGAIDERSRVVGQGDTRAVAKSGHHVTHAFLWQNGRARDLGTLGYVETPGVESSYAVDVNEHGEVIGASCRDVGALCRAFLWKNGTLTDLGTLGGTFTEPAAVNNRGEVVGTAKTGEIGTNRSPIRRAFLWRDGEIADLGTLGGPSSGAVAINDRGQIVGTAGTATKAKTGYFAGSPTTHAFLWQDGTMRDLGTLGGEYAYATAINGRGQVLGGASTKTAFHAFLWSSGRMRDLGTLGGENSQPAALNERGQVVGWAATAVKNPNGETVTHAFLWENGTITDLGSLGGNSRATAINERGQVVGWSETDSGVRHAVLWTPRSEQGGRR